MVPESLSPAPRQNTPPRLQSNVRKITFGQWSLALFAEVTSAPNSAPDEPQGNPREYRHGTQIYHFGRNARSSRRACRNRFGTRRTRDTRTEKSLYARRLSSLCRRDPECQGDHRLPAAAESQPERSLPRGLRAVRDAMHQA